MNGLPDLSSRCCAVPYRNARTTGSRCWHRCFKRIDQLSRSQRVSRRTDLLSDERINRLPIDLGTLLPVLQRCVRTLAAEIAEDLEWSHRIARKIIGLVHRRAKARYNEQFAENQYMPGALVRVNSMSTHKMSPQNACQNFSVYVKFSMFAVRH